MIIHSRKWVRLVRDKARIPLLAMMTKYCHIDTMSIAKCGFTTLANAVKFYPPEKHEYIFGNASDSLTEDEMQTHKFTHSLMMIRVKAEKPASCTTD